MRADNVHPVPPRTEKPGWGHTKLSTALIGGLIGLVLTIVIAIGVVYYYASDARSAMEGHTAYSPASWTTTSLPSPDDSARSRGNPTR